MKALVFLIVLGIVAAIAYKLYQDGAFSGALTGGPPAQAGAAAPQQAPAAPARQEQGQQAQAEQEKQPRPGDVVGGVVRSGKRVGQGASKAFGGVDFGGKR